MRNLFAILAIILALATWTMWPALSAPESTMVCNWMHPDCISNNWLMIWVAEQLSSGESIGHNAQYYWPVGDAPVLAGNGTEGVLYTPLHLLFGWPGGAVAYLWIILVINGLGGWTLGRALGAERWPALLPAAIAIGSPYLLGELHAGRYSQVSIGWMLLTLSAWICLCERPGPLRAVGAGALWAITAFFYWFHAWFVALALVGLLLNRRLHRTDIPWRSLAIAAGSAAVLIAPWAWIFAQAWTEIPGTAEAFPPVHAAQDSAWPSLPFMHAGAADTGAMSAIVWTVGLCGAASALLKGGHRARWALGCWAGFTVLAMGPFASWAPYTLLYDLAPPLRRFWWPLRHVVLAGVLWAAMGAVWLSTVRWNKPVAGIVALSAPLMLHMAQIPHQVGTTKLNLDTPDLQAIAALADGVLLQLPIAPQASGTQLRLLFQIRHKKTLMGGHAQWVDRVRPAQWDARLTHNSYLRALRDLELGNAGSKLEFDPEDLQALRASGLRWLMLDRATFPLGLKSAVLAHRAAANALFGPPIHQGRGIWVWDIQSWTGAAQAPIGEVVWERGLEPAGPQAPLAGRRPHPPSILHE